MRLLRVAPQIDPLRAVSQLLTQPRSGEVHDTIEDDMGIIIAGYLDFAPEISEQLIRDAKPLIQAALDEPGCIAYDWTFDPEEPGRVHVYEEWTSEEALDGHFNGAPYRDMGAHLNGAGAGILNIKVQKYRFDLAEPVYDEEEKPRSDFFTEGN
jgi:quinol monooxygenase YgiN